MKFNYIIALLFFSPVSLFAQSCLPAGAEAFYLKAMQQINTKHARWISTELNAINAGTVSLAKIETDAAMYGNLGQLAEGDIEALAFLVMMETSKAAQEDLKSIMDAIKAMNKQKQALREAVSLMRKRETELKNNLRKEYMTRKEYDSIKNGMVAIPILRPLKLKLPFTDSLLTMPVVREQWSVPLLKPGNLSPAVVEFEQLFNNARDKLDNMNEMGEMESLRMQLAMDRYNKIMSTLSNMMKKISKTEEEIIQNLK